MRLSDFIASQSLRIVPTVVEGPDAGRTTLRIEMTKGAATMVAHAKVRAGHSFNTVSYLWVIQDTFRKLERAPESLGLSAGELQGMASVRDELRRVLGDDSYRVFIDKVGST